MRLTSKSVSKTEQRTPLRIAVTLGEPAGIGPDLALGLRSPDPDVELVFIADSELMAERAAVLGVSGALATYTPDAHVARSLLAIHGCHNRGAGTVDSGNARYVLDTLDRAIAGCLSGEFAALVTGPVQKSAINAAGYTFTGHTEYLALHSGGVTPVMMLVSGKLRVALATTHLPLAAVPKTISQPLLTHVIRQVHHALVADYGIARPCIGICGLNPHAGEGGYLGREDIEVVAPAIEVLRAEGMRLEGPLPADTAFTPRLRERYDAYVSMFHDQGLPVLKALGFGEAVNVTLGLPFIRTSVDHGTALDLAGTGHAQPGSFEAALRLAVEMARNRYTRSA